MSRIQILTNQAENGSSEAFAANNVDPTYNDNPFIGISGVFDGAKVTLEWQDGNGDWNATDATNDIWQEGALKCPFINSSVPYRLTVSNAGASTSINAWVYNCNLI